MKQCYNRYRGFQFVQVLEYVKGDRNENNLIVNTELYVFYLRFISF